MRFGDASSALLLAAIVGCGGKATTSPSFDGGVSSDGSTGEDAAGPWSPLCPGSAPAEGSPCTEENLSCEYDCGNVVVCAGGTWGGAVGTSPYCPPTGPNPQGCPSTLASIGDGGACTGPASGACVYPAGLCYCVGPFDPVPDAGMTWWCGPGAGCPIDRPRIGSTCDTAGVSCTYIPDCDTQTCTGGYWQGGVALCGGG
jgi:hypothetical protein